MRSTVLNVIALALCIVAELSGTRLQDNPPFLDTYNDCPMIGDGQSAGVQALNRLKNRYTAPSDAQINSKVTLAAMLAPGADAGRWKTSYGAEITGYVEDVKPGGIETVNCHAKDLPDRDTHIELVLDPMNSGSAQRVIVEVTPPVCAETFIRVVCSRRQSTAGYPLLLACGAGKKRNWRPRADFV